MATEKLKRQKSPGTDHIPTEFIKPGVEQFALRSINLLILLGIRRNCLRTGSSRSLCLFIRVIKETSNYTGLSLLSTMHKILTNILLSRLTPYAEEFIGDHQCRF